MSGSGFGAVSLAPRRYRPWRIGPYELEETMFFRQHLSIANSFRKLRLKFFPYGTFGELWVPKSRNTPSSPDRRSSKMIGLRLWEWQGKSQ